MATKEVMGKTWVLTSVLHGKRSHPLVFPVCLSLMLRSYCCSVVQSCPTLWDPMDCSTPGFPVLHYLLEYAQTHVHWVNDAIHPAHPLLSSSHALNLSKYQGHFQWVSSLHQVTKELELHLQHQPFQWIFSVDYLNIDWFNLLAALGTLKSLL